MPISQQLTHELFCDVARWRARENERIYADLTLDQAKAAWTTLLMEIAEVCRLRIEMVETGRRIKPKKADEEFVSAFSRTFRNFALIEMMQKGLRLTAAEKLLDHVLE